MSQHIINYFEESKMKISFEIHTTDTSSKPIILSFDKSMLMPHFYESLITDIEYNTILTEDNILDIFAEDTISNSVLSISDYVDKMSLEQFITLNRNFFPFMPITKNYYKIFVIDRTYTKNKHNDKNNSPIYKNREIKTNHWGDLKNILSQTKKLIYL
jgi:hypothetical protein